MASITDQNFLFMNQGLHPVVNYNYMLRVEAVFDLPCKSIKAFSRELEYEIIQEGGLNDYVHMKRKPRSSPYTLEIERYVGLDFFDPLPLGADLALPVVLFVSRYEGDFNPFTAARSYVFTGCTVIKKDYGELDGNSSGLLVDTTTLSYREFACVTPHWSLENDAPVIGKGIDAAKNTRPEMSLAEIKARSQGYFDKSKDAKKQYDEDKARINDLIEKIPISLKNIQGKIEELKKKSDEIQGVLSKDEEKEKELSNIESQTSLKKKKIYEEFQKLKIKENDQKEKETKLKNKLTETENLLTALKTKEEALTNEIENALNEEKKANLVSLLKEAKDNIAKKETDIEKTKNDLKIAEKESDSALKEKIKAEEDFKNINNDYDEKIKALTSHREEKRKREAVKKEIAAQLRKNTNIKLALEEAGRIAPTKIIKVDAIEKNLPDRVRNCETDNNTVQKAKDVGEARKNFSKVKSAYEEITKDLLDTRQIRKYFENTIPVN